MKKLPDSPLVYPFEPMVNELAERGYAIWDGFIDEEETAALRQLAQKWLTAGAFRAAGVGKADDRQYDPKVRGDLIRWIDRNSLPVEAHFFLDRLDAMIQYLNRSCFLGIRDAELHFAVYPAGAFYKRHLDVFRRDQARKLSVICYLNDDWRPADGGRLRIYRPLSGGGEEAFDIVPTGGRLVCFQSDRFEHEVLPARRDRYSLTGWLNDREQLL